ncbi:MAG: GNAT family N-acetyltransferase [Planctomycetota bacterium]
MKIKVQRASLEDKAAVMSILSRTGFFRANELEIAEEVFDDAVTKGPEGDYQSFVAREEEHNTIGWVCFGPTPCTIGTFDVYWLAVDPQHQNRGVGSFLMQYAADFIENLKGRMIVVETSGNPRYQITRRFYEKTGYHRAASLKDFYADGDDKIIYVKYLREPI